MLISSAMQRVIRVLLNRKDEKLTLRDIARDAKVSLGMTSKTLNSMERSGYLTRKRGIRVKKWEKLLKAWSYSVSIFELEKIQFVASERPQYLIKKIANIGSRNSLEYAFTLFSATEIVSPYVSPAETHLYILKEERDKWEKILPKNNIFPGEKGNVVCFLAGESYFYKRKKIKNNKIISLPQLYTDLFSYGGRGAEAAEKILEAIKRV